ncbi:hypothetical protein EYF80_063587 [Liparis tanakae]|uniref:Uncharacterized protein n=1 Tax=Liparis tanakae TaxID=230148 RepID=A0A4Z2EC14_9TELE|nr:hypothetical protein EYF80_063587 [Liparis tanakae]
MPVIRSSSYPAELEDFLVYRHPDHQDQVDREEALEHQDQVDHQEALERQEILDHQRFLALVDEFQWWLEEILEEEDDDNLSDGGDSQGAHHGGPPRPNQASQDGDQ